MARLNEQPGAVHAENFESLKRRFMRQNRDLARANSVQSLKIRQLEAELAHLRADNVTLGERVIGLESEIQESRARANQQQADRARVEMEKKLREMMGLLNEWGKFTTLQRERRRRSQLPPSNVEQLSPASRRERRSIQRHAYRLEHPEEDGLTRLPEIAEDKSYPCHTLDVSPISCTVVAEEILDSPELRAPPTRDFQQANPNDTAESEETERIVERATLGSEQLLSANLETRRRRRPSLTSLAERDNAANLTLKPKTSHAEGDADAHTAMTGSKRKWVATTSSLDRQQSASNDGFAYTKAIAKSEDVAEPLEATVSAQKSRPLRTALAPKPVNTDPVVSPRKSVAATTKLKAVREAEETDKRPGIRLNPLSRINLGSHISRDAPAEVVLVNVDAGDAEGFFSPGTEEPQRPETPPSGHSAGGIEGPTGIRGSRRARPQISYAEPNLVTKMRRPGKEMIDAVSKDSRRSSANLLVLDSRSSDTGAARTVSLKRPRDEGTHAARIHGEEPLSPSLREGTEPAHTQSRARCDYDVAADEAAKEFESCPRRSRTTMDLDDVCDAQSSSVGSSARTQVTLPPHSMTTSSRERVRRTTIGGEKSRLGPGTAPASKSNSRRRTIETHSESTSTAAASAEPWASDSDREAVTQQSARPLRSASIRATVRRRSMMV